VSAIEARSTEGARALAHEHVLRSCRLLEVILDHVAPAAEAAGTKTAGLCRAPSCSGVVRLSGWPTASFRPEG
jgi:hypothetical protein